MDEVFQSDDTTATGSQPPRLPQHTSIQELNPGDSRLKVLRRNEHDMQEIVDLVAASTKDTESAEFASILREWQAWYSQWRGPQDGAVAMTQATDILSRLFFPTALPQADTSFIWDASISTPSDPLCGQTNGKQLGPITIRLDPTRLTTETDKAFHSRLISTLLHEICHAYTMAWVCHGRCEVPNCKREAKRLRGKTGHGKSWFEMAIHVQLAAKQHLTELDVELDPTYRLLVEARGGGLLGEKDFEFLFRDVDPSEVMDMLNQLEAEHRMELDQLYRGKAFAGHGLVGWLYAKVEEAWERQYAE